MSNEASLKAWKTTRLNDKTATAIPAMQRDLRRIECAIDNLPVIHVAGTKGKGSTCAFVERILRTFGLKTGLFTSPHLIRETERIRIAGRSVAESVFAERFWTAYDRLMATRADERDMPSWFRMLTLLALDVFVHEGVDVAVIEVGLGGRADATNVVQPVVCGVTKLDFDHMSVLGNTLEMIAREKAGIFKRGVPAFTVVQADEAATAMLYSVAAKVDASLTTVVPSDTGAEPCELGIAGKHQKTNAALACSLVAQFFKATGRDQLAESAALRGNFAALRRFELPLSGSQLPARMVQGLAETHWPGRSQLVTRDAARFAIDGAHTVESMRCARAWFDALDGGERACVLVFNCARGKQSDKLLRALIAGKRKFSLVLFTTFRTEPCDGYNRERGEAPSEADQLPSLEWQESVCAQYKELGGSGALECVHSMRDVLARVREHDSNNGKCDVLITGSLYLAGAALEALQVETGSL